MKFVRLQEPNLLFKDSKFPKQMKSPGYIPVGYYTESIKPESVVKSGLSEARIQLRCDTPASSLLSLFPCHIGMYREVVSYSS